MDEKIEWLKCLYSPGYFARYVSIYNATVRKWIPFELWPAQQEALAEIATALGMHTSTVQHSLLQLQDFGYLTIIKKTSRGIVLTELGKS